MVTTFKLLNQNRIPDTPYPDLKNILEVFVSHILNELEDNLIGIYLVGSLATGDFDLDSDVDFLVVTETDLTEKNLENLQKIQEKMHGIDSYCARHLEGSYISLQDLNDLHSIGDKALFYFDNGSTTPEQSTHDNNWHVRWILRERGITLFGQDPINYMQPIPKKELFQEMKRSMTHLIKAFGESINQPLNFLNSQFGQSFIVLTFCRMLHTLMTGTVMSKKAGAEWAKTYVEPRWKELIERAWQDRKGVRFCLKIKLKADHKLLLETHLFLKHIVQLAESVEG